VREKARLTQGSIVAAGRPGNFGRPVAVDNRPCFTPTTFNYLLLAESKF
jgi:hypothetical protein